MSMGPVSQIDQVPSGFPYQGATGDWVTAAAEAGRSDSLKKNRTTTAAPARRAHSMKGYLGPN